MIGYWNGLSLLEGPANMFVSLKSKRNDDVQCEERNLRPWQRCWRFSLNLRKKTEPKQTNPDKNEQRGSLILDTDAVYLTVNMAAVQTDPPTRRTLTTCRVFPSGLVYVRWSPAFLNMRFFSVHGVETGSTETLRKWRVFAVGSEEKKLDSNVAWKILSLF